MFWPMGGAPDPLLQAIPWAIGITGLVIGLLWIRQIIRDIEDN